MASLWRDVRLPILYGLLVLGAVRLVAIAWAGCVQLQCDDFGRFWYSTRAWWAGGSLYALTPASIALDGLPYDNLTAPHGHWLLLPFAWLPLYVAAALWQIVGLACLAVSLRIVAQETGWRPTLAWGLLLLWWTPSHWQAGTGQVAWLLTLPLTLGWRAARRHNWMQAGVWFGMMVTLKPFLLPLIVWLVWRKRWRAVGVAAITGATVLLFGVALFGLAAYREWWAILGRVDWYGATPNASVWGLAGRATMARDNSAPLWPQPEWVTPIALGLCAVVIAGTAIRCWRSSDVEAQWRSLIPACLLISPLGWVYYGWWLLPGFAPKIPHGAWLWLVPTLALSWGQPSGMLAVTWESLSTWALLAIWWDSVRG